MMAAVLDVLPADVVGYWRDAGPGQWFAKNPAFDRDFRERFLHAHESAMRGELDAWADTAEGALALLILLDQFPRNAFRGTGRMFESDDRALEVADRAVRAGFDMQVDTDLRRFFYMPFMHSENLRDQDRCVALAARLPDDDTARHACAHRDVIARFGRFPHRNDALGRATMPDEQIFLAERKGFRG
jgi:uncharacterized protein (DUF924 family)